MIIFDTETTELVAPEASNINRQPRIVEFAAIRVMNESLLPMAGIKCQLESFINPGVPIPPESTKITGITNDMVKTLPKFSAFYESLWNFFLGEDTIVAHNLAFDSNVLRYELTRIDKQFKFPWPPKQICTVEASIGLAGHRLNLGKLHEIATGAPHPEAHRALSDVEALLRCVRWMRKKRLL